MNTSVPLVLHSCFYGWTDGQKIKNRMLINRSLCWSSVNKSDDPTKPIKKRKHRKKFDSKLTIKWKVEICRVLLVNVFGKVQIFTNNLYWPYLTPLYGLRSLIQTQRKLNQTHSILNGSAVSATLPPPTQQHLGDSS